MALDLDAIIASALAGAVFGIGSNLLLQGRKRWTETRALATALNREVVACGRKVQAWAADIHRAADEGQSSVFTPSFPLKSEDMMVFQSISGKLGLFPPWLVFHLVELYGEFRGLRDQYTNPEILTRDQALALVDHALSVLKRIDARVATELEVLAITPYWMKLRYDFDAWRAERTKMVYRPDKPSRPPDASN